MRADIWMARKNYVQEHNKKFNEKKVSFKMSINKFADMKSSEVLSKHTGLKVPIEDNLKRTYGVSHGVNITNKAVPTSLDWRELGAVTSVQDQGYQCGSCYGFSSTGKFI